MMNKKAMITALLAIVVMTGQSQTFTPAVEDSLDFVITGTTPSTIDSVVMWPCAPRDEITKFALRNGQFRVTGRLPRNTFIQIGDNLQNDLLFIVDDTPTHIDMVTGEVKGSPLQERFIACQMRERVVERIGDQFMDSLTDEERENLFPMSKGDQPIETAKDSANVEKFNSLMAEMNALIRQNIRENQDNVIPAWYFFTTGIGMKKWELDELLRKDAPYSRHSAMQRTWEYYWSLEQRETNAGQAFHDFTATDSLGAEHKLSDYAAHGQYVLLDFWASWCGPCIASFPQMRQLYDAYKDRGLQIIGISVDKDRSAWLKALDRYKLPWLQLHSPGKTDGTSASDLYGISTIPTTVLIGQDGTVIGVQDTMGELKAKLKEILSEE